MGLCAEVASAWRSVSLLCPHLLARAPVLHDSGISWLRVGWGWSLCLEHLSVQGLGPGGRGGGAACGSQ